MKVILFPKRAPRPEFQHPAAGPRRSLIVDWRLTARSPSLVLTPRQPNFARRAATFKPEVLAASFAQILELSRVFGERCRPTHALVVLNSMAVPLLDASARDYLWSLFEVPIFEQVLDSAGRVVAFECEAHAGLHLCGTWPDHPFGRTLSGICDCGQLANRLCVPERAMAACAS